MQVAQFWWKNKSLPHQVKLSRTRSVDVVEKEHKLFDYCCFLSLCLAPWAGKDRPTLNGVCTNSNWQILQSTTPFIFTCCLLQLAMLATSLCHYEQWWLTRLLAWQKTLSLVFIHSTGLLWTTLKMFFSLVWTDHKRRSWPEQVWGQLCFQLPGRLLSSRPAS